MNKRQGIRTPGYFGGKNQNNPNGRWVASLLPMDSDVSYCEPFAGMLGVLMQRPPARAEVVNDLNGDIVNWWRCVRDKPKEMARLIALTPRSRAELERARKLLGSGKGGATQRALALFILCNQNLRHAPVGGGWSNTIMRALDARFTGEEVAPMATRLFEVQLECMDAVKLIKRYAGIQDAVLYIDPPYRSADTSPYGDVDIDWGELGKAMAALKGRAAVSGYGDEWDMLGWRKNYFPTHIAQPMKVTNRKRVEVLWTNY